MSLLVSRPDGSVDGVAVRAGEAPPGPAGEAAGGVCAGSGRGPAKPAAAAGAAAAAAAGGGAAAVPAIAAAAAAAGLAISMPWPLAATAGSAAALAPAAAPLGAAPAAAAPAAAPVSTSVAGSSSARAMAGKAHGGHGRRRSRLPPPPLPALAGARSRGCRSRMRDWLMRVQRCQGLFRHAGALQGRHQDATARRRPALRSGALLASRASVRCVADGAKGVSKSLGILHHGELAPAGNTCLPWPICSPRPTTQPVPPAPQVPGSRRASPRTPGARQLLLEGPFDGPERSGDLCRCAGCTFHIAGGCDGCERAQGSRGAMRPAGDLRGSRRSQGRRAPRPPGGSAMLGRCPLAPRTR